ncbi:hypothetical protein [Propionispora hippei]|nr:hypothetical protein [Propionispora hippei]
MITKKIPVRSLLIQAADRDFCGLNIGRAGGRKICRQPAKGS